MLAGNWALVIAWAFSDSEFGTVRAGPPLATLNEIDEKKLAMSGAESTRASTQTRTTTRRLFLMKAFRESNREWLALIFDNPLASSPLSPVCDGSGYPDTLAPKSSRLEIERTS